MQLLPCVSMLLFAGVAIVCMDMAYVRCWLGEVVQYYTETCHRNCHTYGGINICTLTCSKLT